MENTKKTLYKEIQQAYYNATASQEKYTASDKSVTAARKRSIMPKSVTTQVKALSLNLMRLKQNTRKV